MKIPLGKRTGGLVASVVLAALASLALISYMRGVETRAFAGAETLEVYVASETIPAGTAAESALRRGVMVPTQLPRKAVAQGAVSSLGQISGKVAAVDILKGEQILGARFVAPGTPGAMSIPDGHEAYALEVELPPGVAGFVVPGSSISVIGHLDVNDGSRANEPRSAYLVQDVEVLAVGSRVSQPSSDGARGQAAEQQQSSDRVLLTLAVTPSEAEKLTFAIMEGEIYLTLRPEGAKTAKTSGRTRRTAFR